jgi:hypothetical protein
MLERTTEGVQRDDIDFLLNVYLQKNMVRRAEKIIPYG